MKRFLTIAWVIIISGGIFIAISYLKPEPIIEDNSEFPTFTDTKTIAETPDQIQIPISQSTPEISDPEIIEVSPIKRGGSTYTEHLAAGDQYLKDLYLESAIEEYEAAQSLNPQSIDPLNKLGEAHLINNNPEEAKKSFQTARNINQTSLIAGLGIVRAEINLRDLKAAQEQLASLDQNNENVKYYQAIMHILGKDFEGAKNIFENLASSENQEIVNKANKFLEKYRTYSFFTESEPLHLQVLLAKALTEVKEYEASIPLLFDVINEKNNYRDAWTILGFAYLNTDKSKDAIDAFSQANALSPDNPQILFFLGISHFADNDIDQAIFYIEAADDAGYEPKENIDLKLGELYLQAGREGISAKKYEDLLEKNLLVNMDIYIRAVWLQLDHLNNPQKALELAQKAQSTYPNEAMSYNLVGWAYTALGEYREAQENLNKAITLNPHLDSAYYNLGRLYEEQSMEMIAKQYYEKAYEIGQGSSIGNLAAQRFNNLNQTNNSQLFQVNTLQELP